MTVKKSMCETLRVVAPEGARKTLSKVLGNDHAAFQDLSIDLHFYLCELLKNVDDLHKDRIQYLLKKIYDSTVPEVYAEALLEHVQFLKNFKGGNNGS